MDFSALEQNIYDVIEEGQIKLGYRREAIGLYYPLSSLNNFIKSKLTVEEMTAALAEFAQLEEDKLGRITVSNEGERFCLELPPEASEYVRFHRKRDGFLNDFIAVVSRHGVTMDEVIDRFRKYSDCVHVEKMTGGEFDYLVYFEDGKPDAYRYCLTDEGCHIIYHRFTSDDYQSVILSDKA